MGAIKELERYVGRKSLANKYITKVGQKAIDVGATVGGGLESAAALAALAGQPEIAAPLGLAGFALQAPKLAEDIGYAGKDTVTDLAHGNFVKAAGDAQKGITKAVAFAKKYTSASRAVPAKKP